MLSLTSARRAICAETQLALHVISVIAITVAKNASKSKEAGSPRRARLPVAVCHSNKAPSKKQLNRLIADRLNKMDKMNDPTHTVGFMKFATVLPIKPATARFWKPTPTSVSNPTPRRNLPKTVVGSVTGQPLLDRFVELSHRLRRCANSQRGSCTVVAAGYLALAGKLPASGETRPRRALQAQCGRAARLRAAPSAAPGS